MMISYARYTCFLTFLLVLFATSATTGQGTQVRFLSGTDKDHTINWQFKVSGGRNSGKWATIPVPSNWEMQGFGTYHYWSDWAGGLAPDSIGEYKYQFAVPADWKGKAVNIVFGGSMTDTEVKVNGKLAGPLHQGGFYEFRYDITDLVHVGDVNLLEVNVKRFSANKSINLAERRADFWQFSGIYRPVWLEAFPEQHIVRTAINARHTGDFAIDVFLDGISTAAKVVVQLQQLNGKKIGKAVSAPVKPGQQVAHLQTTAQNIKPWSAEWPNRYQVKVMLQNKRKVLHEETEKFGFRTVEVRKHDGLYVNGAKVMLKGANRHTFWPTSGRTTSKALSIQDVNLMKDMNMNAVCMSHYPPDRHFLEVTDSLGLYVLDELTGWQDAYDTEVGEKLVRELVIRDVNHPSILLWDNGNEGGWNTDLDDDFARWDPQARTVIHPWANFNGINTGHYEVYDCCTGTFFHGNDLIMPTEFLHGLYDGGAGAGLEDWWNLVLHNPLTAGGFLWAYADEGIVRDDKDGMVDAAGNSGPDGIVGPYRQKEGSFFTIKEVWAPVYLPLSEQDNLPAMFNSILQVENRYDNTNLKQVHFSWQLVDFPAPGSTSTEHAIAAEGMLPSPEVLPHQIGLLQVKLPPDWQTHDAFYLTATDPYGRNIYTWTWMIPEPQEVAQQLVQGGTGRVRATEKDGLLRLAANGTEVQLSTKTGLLQSASHNGKAVVLSNGPRLVSGEASLKTLEHHPDGNDYVVEATFEGTLKKITWRMLPDGWLQLNYAYQFKGGKGLDYLGVTFDFPEDQVKGMRWLGRGPYRVWKNRMKGQEFGVWQKAYNDAMTGVSWEYPEFKGFHADVYWATLQTKQVPVTMVFASDAMFLRLFTPREPEGESFDPKTTHVNSPAGDISFLQGIAPIGTKFHTAAEHGPAGQPNLVPRLGMWYEEAVYFYFGDDLPLPKEEASKK
ncbi:glycoside hydrolase family 2 TIM barrel-domain containing protein [Pontibacter chitinilyticus]|uniref:glycoside hydrolase family 2 TIM barrel-domain containing protein n=1 Tax=Pontibacter chitinilyticus TaxID=2674989 RepID=UPI0032194F01